MQRLLLFTADGKQHPVLRHGVSVRDTTSSALMLTFSKSVSLVRVVTLPSSKFRTGIVGHGSWVVWQMMKRMGKIMVIEQKWIGSRWFDADETVHAGTKGSW